MPDESLSASSADFQHWVDELERKWLAGLVPDPQVAAIIITNPRDQVLLQLRDDDPTISFPNAWSLPGGIVEPPETPQQAATRELKEETGLELALTFWKSYKRKARRRAFTIEQHVFSAATDSEVADMILGEGQALQYFGRAELSGLSFAYEFDQLLDEFFDHQGMAG